MPCQHPGKILLQHYLEPRKISQNALARAIKVPPRRINEIIHGKRAVTADTAVRLAIYFGGSAIYWSHLQSEYEIELAQEKIKARIHMNQPLHVDEEKLKPGMPDSESRNNNEPKPQGKNIRRRIMR